MSEALPSEALRGRPSQATPWAARLGWGAIERGVPTNVTRAFD